MKSLIVANGAASLRQTPEFQARLQALRESVRARHVAELAAAGFVGRLLIRWRMAAEYRRERRNVCPTAVPVHLPPMRWCAFPSAGGAAYV